MLRIMLVEDHDRQRVLVKTILKRLGFSNVVEAVDGKQALKAFPISRPNLLITDMEMPNLSGVELVRKIRETDAAVPIIMLTAHAKKSVVVEAINAGANAYVLKPTDPEILATKIEELTGVGPAQS